MNGRKTEEEGDAVLTAPEHGREPRDCQLSELEKDGGVRILKERGGNLEKGRKIEKSRLNGAASVQERISFSFPYLYPRRLQSHHRWDCRTFDM